MHSEVGAVTAHCWPSIPSHNVVEKSLKEAVGKLSKQGNCNKNISPDASACPGYSAGEVSEISFVLQGVQLTGTSRKRGIMLEGA